MIIPHLLFAHFVADYLLQTDWLVFRKGQAWDGLLLHGVSVWLMSLLALAPYWEQVFLPLLILFGVHTIQDWLKVYLGPRLRIHLAIPYFADQVLHYLAIIVFARSVEVSPEPSHFMIFSMALGAALIAVTRFYEVSWWSNWFEMILYMNRWRTWGYLERVGMLLLSSLGLLPMLAAPLLAIPRLYYAYWRGTPLWRQKHGIIEWGLGIIFSLIIGYLGLHQILEYYL